MVVPFAGDRDEAQALVATLDGVGLRDSDDLFVVDNTQSRVFGGVSAPGRIEVVFAADEFSSYYARNAGAERASNDWILFVDADCVPAADLLDRFFDEPVGHDVGAIAGAVVTPDDPTSTLRQFTKTRRLVDQEQSLFHNFRPFAATANLLVRRDVWRDLGGFAEGVRSGGDVDFSWRLADAGYRLDYAPKAQAEHAGRDRLRKLLRQKARYGAGRGWLVRRYPGCCPPLRTVRFVSRALAAALYWMLRGRFERGRLRVLDAGACLAETIGYFLENQPRRPARDGTRTGSESPRTVLFANDFPGRGPGAALARASELSTDGRHVRIEAWRRSDRPDPWLTRRLDVRYLEDDGFAHRLRALLGLAARHPLRVARESTRRRYPGLAALAPPALRLRRGTSVIVAHGTPDDIEVAEALARLAGVPIEATAPAAARVTRTTTSR